LKSKKDIIPGPDGLRTYLDQIETCAYCPKLCRFSCPVAEADKRETTTPWGRQSMLHQVLLGGIKLDSELAGLSYMCLSCERCAEFCEHGDVLVPQVMRVAREVFRKQGFEPEPVMELRYTFKKYGNPKGKNLSARVRSLVPDRFLAEGAKAGLFLGCEVLTGASDMIGPALELLDAALIDYVAVHEGNEQCCGLPLYEAGDKDAFYEHAERVLYELAGYRMVVSLCPACTYTLKVLYPEQGLDHKIEVLHITELLARHGSNLKISAEAGKAVYFDPCYLGRYLGVYDQPRALAAKALGGEPMELFRNKREAYCCGGGSLLNLVSPGTASAASAEVHRQADLVEADKLVTACPRCRSMLKKESKGIEVEDVVELLASRLTSDP